MGCMNSNEKGGSNPFIYHDDEKTQFYVKAGDKLRPISPAVFKQLFGDEPKKESANCFAKTEDNKIAIGDEINCAFSEAVETRTFKDTKSNKYYLLVDGTLRHIPENDTFKSMFGCDFKATFEFEEQCGIKIGDALPTGCGPADQSRLYSNSDAGTVFVKCNAVLRYLPDPAMLARILPGMTLDSSTTFSNDSIPFPFGAHLSDADEGLVVSAAEEEKKEEEKKEEEKKEEETKEEAKEDENKGEAPAEEEKKEEEAPAEEEKKEDAPADE